MRFAVILLVAAAMAAGPVSAQDVSPWTGTWHLNVGKSSWNGPAPYVRGTWRVEASGGALKMVYYLVGTRGGVTRMEWTGRFDGADYALQGPDAPVTYAYAPIDARTVQLVAKVDGNPTAVATLRLSPDGRTLTTETTVNGPRGRQTTTTIYEKK
jgi:hypothetical protein